MTQENNFRCFSSWSGGKDSCLALYRMTQTGAQCGALFTMFDESGEHSRSHGLSPALVKAQAAAMGLPLFTGSATWPEYETQFKAGLARFPEQGLLHGVFGDIDLVPHRQWVERVCQECGLTAHLPLWQKNREELVREFLAAGFKALIVVVDRKRMPADFLGREINEQLLADLVAIGVDGCGENGEFHTFVYDGPLFQHPVDFEAGESLTLSEHSLLPIRVSPEPLPVA